MKKEVLFFHNALNDYRVPLFQKLTDENIGNLSVKIVFTEIELNKKIYGNDISREALNSINHEIVRGCKDWYKIIELIKKQQVYGVLIPVTDTLYEIILALIIFFISKFYKKSTFYFWEAWVNKKVRRSISRKLKDKIRKILSSIIIKNVDLLFAGSSKTKEYFLTYGIKETKVLVVPNTSLMPICKIDNIREKNNIPFNCKIIMYFGRIIKRKGLDLLIIAYNNLPNDIKKKTWLLIIGDGEFAPYCKSLIEKLKICNFSWIGYVHPNDRYNYFFQCDIFVLPSYFSNGICEPWGLTINEAIQCGKVIISTIACAAAIDLINSKNGFLIEDNNIQQLTYAIIECFKTNIFETAKIENRKILNTYNYNNFAKSFINGFNMYVL